MRETTIVLLECRPVTGYRAVFDDVDEITGKQVTSPWCATLNEVFEKFGGHEWNSYEVNDMRIHELRVLLEECEAAYRSDGSPGVSGVLAGRALSRAQADCNLADADLDDARLNAAASELSRS